MLTIEDCDRNIQDFYEEYKATGDSIYLNHIDKWLDTRLALREEDSVEDELLSARS